MTNNKAPGMDSAVTAKALQGGADVMANTIHAFCVEVINKHTAPDQWITNVIVPLLEKGDLSLMTNYGAYTDVNCCKGIQQGIADEDQIPSGPYITEKPSWLPPK